MRTFVPVVLALVACKGKSDAPAPAPALAPKAMVVAADAAGSARAAKPAPTKQQLAAYKQHMKAGWALQKQQKWGESVPEFEAAVAAIELDQRALSELGWSAMNAGDFVKARKADEQAVRVAIDPKVKAAALFNLGTVMAKTSDTDGALRAYQASLQLRPNKTVEQELAKLGKTSEVGVEPCDKGEDPCGCIARDALLDPDPEDPPKCEDGSEPRLPAGWKLVVFASGPWKYDYVLDEHGQIAANVGVSVDKMRLAEEMALDDVDKSTVGGHTIVKLVSGDIATETSLRGDDDGMNVDTTQSKIVTVCVLGDAKTPTRCPLRGVPLSISHMRSVLETGGEKPLPGSETTVDLQIAADGTATIKLVKGASDSRLDALVGPHRLW